MDIYEKIKNRRLELGLSQEELALKTGYTSRSSINKIEAGQVDISQSKILAFAKALQVSPAYLMGWEDEPAEYYNNPEVAEYAQEIYENPDLRILFDASKKISKRDMEIVVNLVKSMKKDEGAD